MSGGELGDSSDERWLGMDPEIVYVLFLHWS